MGSNCSQVWQNRVHGKAVMIRNGNPSITATGPVRLGTESPAVLGREEGEEWVVTWSAAPSTRDPHLTWVPVGLHAPDWKRGVKEVRLENAESSVGSSCPRPAVGTLLSCETAVRSPSPPLRVDAGSGWWDRAGGRWAISRTIQMGPSWPPAPTCCSTHWDTGAVSTSGAWLPQKHTRDFAHARFCTCAILHMRDWRQHHGDPRQIPCSPHIKMAIKGGLCGFFRKNG